MTMFGCLFSRATDVCGSEIHAKANHSKTDLDYVAKYLSLLKKPTVLITSDGDRPVPSSYDTKLVHLILNHPNITAWYTQNYDKSIIHSKLKYMPIGFDLHTKSMLINNSRDQKLQYMCHCRETTHDKIHKVFSDSHLRITHPERRKMYDILKNNDDIIFLKGDTVPLGQPWPRGSFQKITQLYNKYQFVLSPRGRGLDCHRTWELFLAGCIVITRTSSIDDMYVKNNLPVVILKTWDELNTVLPDKMERWYKDHFHKTSPQNILPRLTFNYWTR